MTKASDHMATSATRAVSAALDTARSQVVRPTPTEASTSPTDPRVQLAPMRTIDAPPRNNVA